MDEISSYFSIPGEEKTWKTFQQLLKKARFSKLTKEDAERLCQERQRLKPQSIHIGEKALWLLLCSSFLGSIVLLCLSLLQANPLAGYSCFLIGFLLFNFAPHFLGHMLSGYLAGIRFRGMKFTPVPRLVMRYETYLLASPKQRASMRLGGGIATLVTLDVFAFFAWHANIRTIAWIGVISAILITWGFIYGILGAFKILPHRNPDADIIRAKRELG